MGQGGKAPCHPAGDGRTSWDCVGAKDSPWVSGPGAPVVRGRPGCVLPAAAQRPVPEPPETCRDRARRGRDGAFQNDPRGHTGSNGVPPTSSQNVTAQLTLEQRGFEPRLFLVQGFWKIVQYRKCIFLVVFLITFSSLWLNFAGGKQCVTHITHEIRVHAPSCDRRGLRPNSGLLAEFLGTQKLRADFDRTEGGAGPGCAVTVPFSPRSAALPGACIFWRGAHGCRPPAALGRGASGELAALPPARRPLRWRAPAETRSLMGKWVPSLCGRRRGTPHGLHAARPVRQLQQPVPTGRDGGGCLSGLGRLCGQGGGPRESTTLLKIF